MVVDYFNLRWAVGDPDKAEMINDDQDFARPSSDTGCGVTGPNFHAVHRN